ncbi:MAG: Acetolactate synthase isozyme 3 small subunit [Alphaproteobacteria bacterium MarineAlpha6_Bin4]|nr:MAG: Acetolactate synthase isozyme 3 small subunit [Alphaproteobacteria bacterium MarineAlpha6_Bin3]PPR38482.1 MAG: Acetolactate synthase isozyme 3 small subunit [Alphaproteobacteria bacterium MarineAlpha6_Bin4]
MSNQKKEKHTISVLVNDEPGALARVIGLFSGRGYNIDSLTVAPVNLSKKHSRIIIVTSGTKIIIEQIIHSLERLIQVKKVIDLTSSNSTNERELALVKIIPKTNKVNLLKKTVKKYKAKLIFNNSRKYAFEITNSPSIINSFIIELNKIGTIDVSRTGLIAILKE